MAFMFADPIIKEDVNNPNKMIETHMPLDLDKEYMDIKESICNEAKKFTIKKIAINSRSLQDTVVSNPKIIHISCHGDFSKKDKLFYLAFEEEHIGKEVKFMENNLSEIMGSAKGH
jgi:CHAT domain-containing protein